MAKQSKSVVATPAPVDPRTGKAYPYKLIRTKDAGVFTGYITTSEEGRIDAILLHARRIWYWKGAASLSELAMKGVAYPNECKFPIEVARLHVYGVIEILDVTNEAKSTIDSVPIWTGHTK